MLFSTPQTRRASRTRSGRTSAATISSGLPPPQASGTRSKLTMLASPMESNVPSLPHMQTDIQEKCGDGIMSAIDFTLQVEKIADPKGDRIAVHMNGKFLPYRRF